LTGGFVAGDRHGESTLACAKIIDEVNKLALNQLRRPKAPQFRRRHKTKSPAHRRGAFRIPNSDF